MGTLDTLIDHLDDSAMTQHFNQIIEALVNDEVKHQELLNWIANIQSEFLFLLDLLDDSDEIKTCLVFEYIQLRSQWEKLNTKMNYQAVKMGSPYEEIMVKGSLLSNFLDQIEDFLAEEEVDYMTDFLKDPVKDLR